jgi:hypothetical protein
MHADQLAAGEELPRPLGYNRPTSQQAFFKSDAMPQRARLFRGLAHATACLLAVLTLGDVAASAGEPRVVRSGDGYVKLERDCWTFGTDAVERVLVLRDGRLLLERLEDRRSGRQLVSPDRPLAYWEGPRWRLEDATARVLAQGEIQFDVKLACETHRLTKTHVVYPGTSLVREWSTIENTGTAALPLADPPILEATARLGESIESLDFHWMTGAHNEPGCWTMKTESLEPAGTRQFDSYDPFPPRGGPSPNDERRGSESYAPWYALMDRTTGHGLVIGWDFMGHWRSRFEADADGRVRARLEVAGYRRELPPGETVTTPKAFVALFRDDLDNAGNEVLDWQYQYLWDYTREGWFPAIPMLVNWHKGTNWGKPDVPWWGSDDPDIDSQFSKIFRAADLLRYVGGDLYHRDWGWWDRAGDWNGPDFGRSGRYLRKYGIGQIIYAFLYTVHPQATVARQHPEWLIGQTLDMSNPAVVRHIQSQLDDFHSRWGDFAWRNDSTPTAPRGDDDTGLLAQEQNFRTIIQTFLDKYPRSSFQGVNGGGNEAGYDYVRLSGMFQFSDGGALGLRRNYDAARLLPPDKCMDNGDAWRAERFDKASWRGLLSMAIVVTGDTWDKQQLEGMRELFDLYHYLAAQGVVGRWVKVYRPGVEGDEPAFYFQRLSRDRRRGLIVPARAAPAKVTLRPKGLLLDERYLVTFHESAEEMSRSGRELMEQGITIDAMPAGELVYLNLPLHPGSTRDKQPPSSPTSAVRQRAENMGYPGVELSWKPATDDNWVSYYEIVRDGQAIDKVAKGTFYFDHSAGADMAARYEIVAVDGAGNRSAPAAVAGMAGTLAGVFDDSDPGVVYRGAWRSESNLQPAHAETIRSSDEKGASVEIAFEGSRVLWFSKLGDDCGEALVSIDGGPPERVDTYCSDDVWGVCVFQKDLPPGKHVITITVAGDRHRRSQGTRVYVDGLRAEIRE